MNIRELVQSDRSQWEVLWTAYLDFYKTTATPEMIERAWSRIHDNDAPCFALAAFDESGKMLGITHFILHFSMWTEGQYCYLQDLFTIEEARGRGVGRALIEAVKQAATAKKAGRLYWLTHETNATAIALYEKVAARSGFIQYRVALQ
jgi:GNAT superfamily N-acetyltransferase